MARGVFVYDQRAQIALHRGDSLVIPDSAWAAELIARQQRTWLDINVPEFRLRIVEGTDTLYTFPIRVGQNKKGFLATVGRETDWRTRLGTGEITGIYRNPVFRNLQTGKVFELTRRDDGRTTRMPQIPTLEPEIDGVCSGQLIHATTNPATLGKAYSHGCIGTREGDAWRIYYYAPLGTRIVIRYDLKVLTTGGDTIVLPDIYARK
jgi:L,D-transpeptidase ErfK/SrfK